MNSRKIITILLIVLALAIVPVYWLNFAFTNISIHDGLYLATVVIALIGAFYATNKYGIKQVQTGTLVAFTCAIFSAFIGELIFEYYYIVYKHTIPFPSIKDLFYLLYYFFFFIGLLYEIKISKINWKKINRGLLSIAILSSLLLIGIYAYFEIIQAYSRTGSLLANVVLICYGLGDICFIIISLLLVILVREYHGGKLAVIWFVLLIGLLFNLSNDLLLVFYNTQYHKDIWFYKSIIDTISMIGYLCFAYSFFQFGFSIDDAAKLAKEKITIDDQQIELKREKIQTK